MLTEMMEWWTRHSRNRKRRNGDVGVENEKGKREGEKRRDSSMRCTNLLRVLIRISIVIYSQIAFPFLCLCHLRAIFLLKWLAWDGPGLQYSGPVITLRVQHGQQIQFNSILGGGKRQGVGTTEEGWLAWLRIRTFFRTREFTFDGKVR